MSETWLPRLLFLLTIGLSVSLILLVLLAPVLLRTPAFAQGAPVVLKLFARDAALRRTTMASALGLLVTACVFFRPPPSEPKKPVRDMTGA